MNQVGKSSVTRMRSSEAITSSTDFRLTGLPLPSAGKSCSVPFNYWTDYGLFTGQIIESAVSESGLLASPILVFGLTNFSIARQADSQGLGPHCECRCQTSGLYKRSGLVVPDVRVEELAPHEALRLPRTEFSVVDCVLPAALDRRNHVVDDLVGLLR